MVRSHLTHYCRFWDVYFYWPHITVQHRWSQLSAFDYYDSIPWWLDLISFEISGKSNPNLLKWLLPWGAQTHPYLVFSEMTEKCQFQTSHALPFLTAGTKSIFKCPIFKFMMFFPLKLFSKIREECKRKI